MTGVCVRERETAREREREREGSASSSQSFISRGEERNLQQDGKRNSFSEKRGRYF